MAKAGVAAPCRLAGLAAWVDGVDWSDWRAWLERVASADWAAGQWAPAPWEQPPRAGEIPLTLRAFAEDEPGDRIRDHLAMTWPAFRQWWGDARTPGPRPRKPGPGWRSTCRNSCPPGSA